MFDVVVVGGTVVDGTEAPAFRADVGISGETIEAIGDLSKAEARRVVDATGHVVSPVYRRYIAGILGEPPEDLDMSSVAAFRANYHKKVAINTAYTVAHGALRLETLGFRDVPLVGEPLEKAKRLVREGIEQGAVGFATGLSYRP
ncbi:MAG: hypothetical protein IH956_05835, partial [Chloroflexi bacterium]|nr:hypothetical protein [Chloroflexota bacterium]